LDALPAFLNADLATARAVLADLQRLHDAQQAANARVETIDEELAEIRVERAAQVDKPRQTALRRGDALAALLDARERPEGDLQHDAAWLAALCADATAAAARLDADAAGHDRDAATAAEAAQAALGDFAVADALREALDDRRADRRTAQLRIARAETDLPQVEALVAKIAALRVRRAALDELARLLNPGQFVGWLVQRRQQHLLAVASEILAGMTGDRYRFTADFTVHDARTGQPRSPRTLSGGESFLASLALALGMAEIAARGGGRIGSLYLDEGFGSLDPNALDEAIEALEARARAGQMIMVISHVPTVAQRIERVLRVSPSPSGSSAAWLDDADRDELLTPVPGA
jgi:exonuclease SbcC